MPQPSPLTRSLFQAFESVTGATVQPTERTIRHHKRIAALTPREVELIELLAASSGTVVSYQTLYSEILGRPFRGGDTSNMRVLLGKLAASCRSAGLVLRDWVEVIPKTGYRYHVAGIKRRR